MSLKFTLRLAAKNPEDNIVFLQTVVDVLAHGPFPIEDDIIELVLAERPMPLVEVNADEVRHIPDEQLETTMIDVAQRMLAKIEEKIDQGGVTITVSATEIKLQIDKHKSWLREFVDEGGKMVWVTLKEMAVDAVASVRGR